MKVLWFSNSPAAAFDQRVTGTGGWLCSLDRALQNVPDVELSVAFLYPYEVKAFRKGRTMYFPIFTGNILMENIMRRLFRKRKPLFTEKYMELIANVRPDIIHIHGTENTFHTIIGRTDVPIVVSIQGNPSVYAYKFRSGYYGSFENEKNVSFSLKSAILGRNSFRDGLKNLIWMSNLEKKTMLNAKCIIGRTDWDRRISRILAPNSQYFIGDESLRDVFYQKSWHRDKPESKLVIHTTNGNCYYKGFETLCYALTLLNNLEIDVEWRVAGISKSSKIVDITKKFLGENFPKKGLVLLGSLGEYELVESLLSSHLYVMPSHIENSPNSLCEAMILGMPCIATLAGGTDSLLTNKKDGLIIQDGDPWSMAGAILELMNDWEKAVSYGRNARDKALHRHDRKRIVSELLNTYKLVLHYENNISPSV